MSEINLEFLARSQERILDELRLVRADVGDVKADIEVMAAIIRRLDTSVQNLTGEVRALAGQQSRQRQKLERLDARLGKFEEDETR